MPDGFGQNKPPARVNRHEASLGVEKSIAEPSLVEIQLETIEKVIEVKDKIGEEVFSIIIKNIIKHPALFTLGPLGAGITTAAFYPDHPNIFGEDTTGVYETLIGSGLGAGVAALLILVVVEVSKTKPPKK